MSNEIVKDLIIFEMANSHQGSVDHGIAIIKEMGKIARKYNIKAAVKLQYRNLDTFIHPDYKGRDDVAHIPRFESTKLSFEQFSQLIEVIKKENLITMSTPFDEDGVSWCRDQGVEIIKIASCSATDWPLLEEVAKAKKPIIISVGGKTISEIDKIYNFFEHRGCTFSFMHCIAEYPASEDRIQLDFIDVLKRRYPNVVIGYSGHEDPEDIKIPLMAIAKGAEILERHVGLPTESIKLNAYSMNPEQADRWVEAILEGRNKCGLKKGKEKFISQIEVESLQSLMRGCYARRDIEPGQKITRKDVFFAMPCHEGQMASGEFKEGIFASKKYNINEKITEHREITNIQIARDVIHEAKGFLLESGIHIGKNYDVELSHHYGIKHLRQTGAIIINIVNREYCKKLIIVLPGQDHPNHYHKIKEETFQLLYGELDIDIEGQSRKMLPGDTQTVLRGEMHKFSSSTGAVFEEISTTHVKGDSYYEDEFIAKQDLMDRKTVVESW
ncbi:MAG: N-acetylneuraminate synthase family protein [Lachnospiraceae bacterium]|nr:N-acetylneuraminate synthase family protein [Lachnospiraceae bacterium]